MGNLGNNIFYNIMERSENKSKDDRRDKEKKRKR